MSDPSDFRADFNPSDNTSWSNNSFYSANSWLGSTPLNLQELNQGLQELRIVSASLAETKKKYEELSNNIQSQNAEAAKLTKEIENLKKKLASTSKTIQKEVTDRTQEIDKLGDEAKDLKANIGQARNKTLEPLAVFVGLFTFVSISFQMFANVKDAFLWVPLAMIMLGGIGLFAGLVIVASGISSDSKSRIGYASFLLILSIIPIFLGFNLYRTAKNTATSEINNCIAKLQSPPKLSVDDYAKLYTACKQ